MTETETYAAAMERVRLMKGWVVPTEDIEGLSQVLSRLDYLEAHWDDVSPREERIGSNFYAVCLALGMKVWNDAPDGQFNPEALLERVERAMQARELNAFLRGLRSGNASRGLDPDELPEEHVRE